jgi:hypothetical protein
MKEINFQGEVLHVSVPISFPLEYIDFIIKSFQWPCGYSKVKPVQYSRAVSEQGLNKCSKFLDDGAPCPGCPGSKKTRSLLLFVLKPELLQFFFQVVGLSQRLIDLKRLRSSFSFFSFLLLLNSNQ